MSNKARLRYIASKIKGYIKTYKFIPIKASDPTYICSRNPSIDPRFPWRGVNGFKQVGYSDKEMKCLFYELTAPAITVIDRLYTNVPEKKKKVRQYITICAIKGCRCI